MVRRRYDCPFADVATNDRVVAAGHLFGVSMASIIDLANRARTSLVYSAILLGLFPASIASADESIASVSRLPAQTGLISSEFTYETAPYPSCHASTIVESDGRLVAAWFGGTEERHPDVGIWLSRRDGDKWSTPDEVANGVESPTERYPTWNPVLFQPKQGPLMLFYKVGPTPRDWWGMLQTSDDGGASWSKPVRLPEGILGPIKNKPIELASGDILCPSSSEHDGWRVHFERTSDLGKTWTRTAAVNDGHEIRAIQPSILVHGDGRLQALGRTRESGIFQVWSEDSGKTWGEMTSLVLPNPNSGTDAVTLADGRHLLVYNHSDQERWPHEPIGQYSYPAVIQTSDGLVHVTYTWRRLKIKHTVIDPAALVLRPIVDGRWPDGSGGERSSSR
jgi:predicted neuraminidase